MKKRFTSAYFKAFILLGSILAVLFLAEFGHRAYEYYYYNKRIKRHTHELYRIAPQKGYKYRMKPNTHRVNKVVPDKEETWSYHLNRHGFRGADFDINKGDRKRILILGDSYPFGWAVQDKDVFSVKLEKNLKKNMGKDKVEVINTGTPGYNTVMAYHLLEEIMGEYDPDIILYTYVMNDAEPQYTIPQHPALVHEDATFWLYERIKEIINKKVIDKGGIETSRLHVRKHKASSKYLDGFKGESRKWKESKNALGQMASLCRSQGKQLIVYIFPDFTEAFDATYPYKTIHHAVREWCKEFNIDAFDFLTIFHGKDHKKYWVEGDGHPNPLAQKIFSDLIAKELIPLLQRSQSIPMAKKGENQVFCI